MKLPTMPPPLIFPSGLRNVTDDLSNFCAITYLRTSQTYGAPEGYLKITPAPTKRMPNHICEVLTCPYQFQTHTWVVAAVEPDLRPGEQAYYMVDFLFGLVFSLLSHVS